MKKIINCFIHCMDYFYIIINHVHKNKISSKTKSQADMKRYMGSLWSDLQYLLAKRALDRQKAMLQQQLQGQLVELESLGMDTSKPLPDAPPYESKKCNVLCVRSDVIILSGGVQIAFDPLVQVREGDKVQIVKMHKQSVWKIAGVNIKDTPVVNLENEHQDEGEVIIIDDDAPEELRILEGKVVLYISETGILIVEPGNLSVKLNDIVCNFTPADDDLIFISMCGNKVEEIKPREEDIFDAVVLYCDNSGGMIQKEDGSLVAFTYQVCDVHYMPRQGDEVCVQAIQCQRKGAIWRALKLVLQKLSARGGGLHDPEVHELLEENAEISTSCHYDCGKLKLGEKGRLSPILLNKSSVSHYLTGVYPLKTVSPNPQFKVLHPLSFPVNVPPGESVRIDFECQPQQEGSWRDLFVFDFDRGQLQIGRFLAVEIELLEHNKGDRYKKPKMTFDSNGNFSGPVVKVNRKHQSPFRRRVPNYTLPENVKQIVQELSESSSDNVLVTLQNRFPFLAEEVDTFNYVPRFKLLLHIEEAEAERTMRRWNMENIPLEKDMTSESSYMVFAPQLTERRPSILFGDSVHVRNVKGGSVYEGHVEETLQQKVKFRLQPSFPLPSSSDLFSIKFAISRSNFKFQHTAIEQGWKKLGNEILFPSEIEPADELQVPYDTVMSLKSGNGDQKSGAGLFNPVLNESQRAAVCHILAGEFRPFPYIIFGPPGTGKTVTLVETVLQIFKLVPVCRILVATPSNNAADLVTELLIRSNPSFKPVTLTRLVAFNYRRTVPAYLQKYSVVLKGEGTLDVDLSRNKITVGTCASIGRLCLLPNAPYYTHVFIDEAGQASEPEAMCAVALSGKPRQIILAGDPKQLGPVIMGRIAVQGGLDTSWLSRILSTPLYSRDASRYPLTQGYNPNLVTMLTKNYRTVPEILSVPSQLFYNNLLVPMVPSDSGPYATLLRNFADELPRGISGPPALVFHGLRGKCCRDHDSPSWYNPIEASQVFAYVTKLLLRNVKPWNIGIITFYAKQTAKVRELLRANKISELKVGSVEEFQGQEREVMILSTVRVLAMDDDSMGFISSPNRINVALTRAKALLIIVGDPHLLKNDPNWRTVLKDCVRRNAYTGCDLPVDYGQPGATYYNRPPPSYNGQGQQGATYYNRPPPSHTGW